MVCSANELARLRDANDLNIFVAMTRLIIYIVSRYNENVSERNLNYLGRLLNRSREHHRISTRTSHRRPSFGLRYQH
jgi:hypothetical protein